MDDRRQTGANGTPDLQPPAQSSPVAAPEDHLWLWVAMAALLLLGLAVIFALPRLVGPVHETVAPEPAAVTPSASDAVAQRDSAHRALQAYLQLRARLDLERAGAWGEPAWSAAAARATAGDRFFAQRQFAMAARDYQAALDGLQQLADNREILLATALEEATAALETNDVPTAIARFETVLVMQPDHPAANGGLERARSRVAVIEQMNRGQAAETNSDLEAARAAYREAAVLDAEYEPAQLALQRLTEQISDRDFNAAMTRVLAALDAGRAGEAGKALAEAERLQPGNAAVHNARQRLQGMRVAASLNSLRRKAANATGSEDWQAAVELYHKALAIDPAAGFARTGLQRAEERVSLHAQFDHYLEKPSRVYSAEPLANAEQLLVTAGRAPSNEPQLARKITALRELVTQASTPVAVTLDSDGETSVVIYHVGRLGRFLTHRLDLLPGDYTIVGSRPGYRDVRKVVSVRPGVSLPPLQVRCEEQI